MPTVRMDVSAATISLSVEECETAVCFLDIDDTIKEVLGPSTFSDAPDVESEAGRVQGEAISIQKVHADRWLCTLECGPYDS